MISRLSVETVRLVSTRSTNAMLKDMGDSAAYTYMLECADGSLYTGWSTDPQKRLQMHNKGCGAKYTRTRLPVKLVGIWQFESRTEAMRFEIKLKSLSRQQKLKLLQTEKEPGPGGGGLFLPGK